MVIGGSWDCAQGFDTFLSSRPDLLETHGPFFEGVAAFSNLLWYIQQITGLLKCPTTCSVDTPFSECSCSCPSYDLENMTYAESYGWMYGMSEQMQYYEFIREYMKWDGRRFMITDLKESDQHVVFKWLLKYTCHPGKLTPFSSPFAAPNDPLFFPLHNYYEKIWSFRRRTTISGNWSDDWGDGFDVDLYGMTAYCTGYHFHDTLPFSNLLQKRTEDDAHYYTNQELYELFDPHNVELPYVYDDFSWSHCPSDIWEQEEHEHTNKKRNSSFGGEVKPTPVW